MAPSVWEYAGLECGFESMWFAGCRLHWLGVAYALAIGLARHRVKLLSSHLAHHTLRSDSMLVPAGLVGQGGLEHRTNIFVGAAAQSGAQIVFLIAEQAGLYLSVGGEAQAVA